MSGSTSEQEPVSVRWVAQQMHGYIGGFGALWVEGEATSFRPRGTRVYIDLRDPTVDMSIPLSIDATQLRRSGHQIQEGDRLVCQLKLGYYAKNGQLSWQILQVKPVGEGALLARMRELKQQLAAEGLFAPERKRALPFLPTSVGLIVGRNSAAVRDVIDNTNRRWPGVQFVIEEVAVQGKHAVPDVIGALDTFQAQGKVDVIVISRGGGSVQDLAPFSNEALVRAVARTTIPVISAIGHQEDHPILDEVADFRASTPTDVAKHLVPDHQAEQRVVTQQRHRANNAISRRIAQELRSLQNIRNRPVLADPRNMLLVHTDRLSRNRIAAQNAARAKLAAEQQRFYRIPAPRQALQNRCQREQHSLTIQLQRLQQLLREGLRQRVADVDRLQAVAKTLSPERTLQRGFAIVQTHPDGPALTQPAEAPAGVRLAITLAHGKIDATSDGTHSD